MCRQGWTEDASPSRFRLASFSAEGGRVDVSLSAMGGGSILDNVNRWRGQLGAAPVESLDAFPRRSVAGREALWIEADGRFEAQGRTVEGARLLGLIAPGPEAGDQILFVKMVGPRADVDRQAAALEEFVQSLHQHEEPIAPVPGGETVGDAGQLSWSLPEGWGAADSASSMRLASFRPDGDPDLDAYIVVLPGQAGGVKPNIDRWLGQVGLPATTDAQFSALPSIRVLGRSSPVVDAIGAERAILGVVAEMPGDRVRKLFVKLVGPSAKVESARESFVAFCESLRMASDTGKGEPR